MSEPFVAELRLVGFNFAPAGWAMANGQVMQISQSTALFSLLGTQFGGDGRSTFALPNLQGAIPIGYGQGPGLTNYTVGEQGGSQSVALTLASLPAHSHPVRGDATGANQQTPVLHTFAKSGGGNMYAGTGATVQMNPGVVSNSGANLAHNNMMPYLTLNWIIALQGVFPSRS
jgi:microcystin-dependent protein